MLTDVRHCSDCGDERDFVQPPCVDGHGADCAEWACADCGAAVWAGGPVPVTSERLVPRAA
jgi:hypothetical protein